MIRMGLSATQQLALLNLLNTHHTIQIGVRVLDLSHNYVDDLSDRFVSGGISVDADAEVDRGLDITLLDPTRSIQLDPDSPSAGSVFVSQMFSIIYRVQTPKKDASFDIPVFCGPLNKVERNGVLLNIKAIGKESLSSDNMWIGRTFRKNMLKTDIIKGILQGAGETKLDIPALPTRQPSEYSVGREMKPWAQAKALAASMGMQLFYDGRGVAVMRAYPGNSSFTADRRNVTTVPQFGYDLSNLSNAVEVIGATPKGSKRPISYRIVAPDAHPLSPWKLGRNGVRRYVNPIVINDTNIRTMANAVSIAKQTLANALLEAVEAQFDMLPMPILEPRDVVYLNHSSYSTNVRINKFTIPLVSNDDSTIGYLRRVTPKGGGRAIRVRSK